MNIAAEELSGLQRQYESDGFVRIEPLLQPHELDEIETELIRYTEDVAPGLPAADIVYERDALADGRRAIRNLWRMEQYSTFFADLAKRPALLQVMNCLVNGKAVVAGVELFAKPAYVGSAVPFHQDNAYFNLVPPDSLTCWIALDDSTLENGCIYYARGSHRGGLRPHKASGVKGNSLMVAQPPLQSEFEQIPGILTRGGAILHNCVLLHRSEQNRSPHSRRGLLIVYRGSHCRVDPEGSRKYNEVLAGLA